jgi:hypothetical protein
LERGIEYTLASTAEPDKHSQQPLQDLLHDRMTQTVVSDLEQLDIFSHRVFLSGIANHAK